MYFDYNRATSSVDGGDMGTSHAHEKKGVLCETQSQQFVSPHQGHPRPSKVTPSEENCPQSELHGSPLLSHRQLVQICVCPSLLTLCVHTPSFVERIRVGARAVITTLFSVVLPVFPMYSLVM